MSSWYQEIEGDLFSTNDSFAFCGSRDFKYGTIGKQFNLRFGRKPALIAQDPKVGEVAMLRIVSENGDRYAFYLVIKNNYNDQAKIVDFHNALKGLKEKAIHYEIKHLSIPQIGSFDAIEKETLVSLLFDVFASSGIKITMYHIDHFFPNNNLPQFAGLYGLVDVMGYKLYNLLK